MIVYHASFDIKWRMEKDRTNVLKTSILFILFMLYFLVTFRNAVSA